ncbi:MAG: hypothetical protein ACREOQ_22615 [Gemmatimonadales bacterium]
MRQLRAGRSTAVGVLVSLGKTDEAAGVGHRGASPTGCVNVLG